MVPENRGVVAVNLEVLTSKRLVMMVRVSTHMDPSNTHTHTHTHV